VHAKRIQRFFSSPAQFLQKLLALAESVGGALPADRRIPDAAQQNPYAPDSLAWTAWTMPPGRGGFAALSARRRR
jgi:hypothetical protein